MKATKSEMLIEEFIKEKNGSDLMKKIKKRRKVEEENKIEGEE